MWRRRLLILTGAVVVFVALVALATVSTATDPSAKLPPDKPTVDYADPKATYRTYIDAVRRNDIKAAKQCWVIDDDNKSGALDTIVGLRISMRQINQVAQKKVTVHHQESRQGQDRPAR